jgi:hypothetical protein
MAGRRKKDKLIAWDLEWQGQHPVNKGSYVRTVQFSWGEKKAICFVDLAPGGKTAFRDRDGKPAVKRLVKLLNEFMADKRAVGHFLVSDLEWAESLGLHPTPGARSRSTTGRAASSPGSGCGPARAGSTRRMMNHAIEETAPLGLEMLAMRYTTAPVRHPAGRLEEGVLQGAGHQARGPGGVRRLPGQDPDPVRQLRRRRHPADRQGAAAPARQDYEGNCCWEPFWESMIIQKPILRIHQNGILVDRKRIDDLTRKFLTARAAQGGGDPGLGEVAGLQRPLVQQVKEFLFGEKLNGKRTSRAAVRIRPPGARSLYVTPLLDTSKPPRRWKDLVEKGGLDRTPRRAPGR